MYNRADTKLIWVQNDTNDNCDLRLIKKCENLMKSLNYERLHTCKIAYLDFNSWAIWNLDRVFIRNLTLHLCI